MVRTLHDLKVSILGVKNRQQFAYLLLSHMSEGLPNPTRPTPEVEVVGPSIDLLRETAKSVLFDRIGTKTPWVIDIIQVCVNFGHYVVKPGQL